MSAQEFQVATVPSQANQANDVFPSTLSGMRVALRIQLECYSIVVVCTLLTFSFLQTQSSAEDASRRERRAYHRQVPRSANAVVVELSTNQPGIDQRSL